MTVYGAENPGSSHPKFGIQYWISKTLIIEYSKSRARKGLQKKCRNAVNSDR